MDRYSLPWETTEQCSARCISGIQWDEDSEYLVWLEAIKDILWNNANKTHRRWKVYEHVTNILWLNYWPKFI